MFTDRLFFNTVGGSMPRTLSRSARPYGSLAGDLLPLSMPRAAYKPSRVSILRKAFGMRKRLAVAVLGFSIILLVQKVEAGICYTVLDLGTLGGTQSQSNALNDLGQVIGLSRTAGDVAMHAYRTAPNSPINPATDDLGTFGGKESYAEAINASGQVVGNSNGLSSEPPTLPFRTAPNSPINPATDNISPLTGQSCGAFGINDSGQVTGNSIFAGHAHAIRTAPNSAINPATDDLGTLGGSSSYGKDINASGQVVGHSFTSGGNIRAFRTAPNSRIAPADNLGTLGGNKSWAFRINARGQVIGISQTSDNDTHAYRTAPNSPITAADDLGTFGGTESWVGGINDRGDVVGQATLPGDTIWHAFLFTDSGGMVDLNNLIDPSSGWVLTNGGDINNKGQIACSGSNGSEYHALLLTPTPEPSTFALLGAGAGALIGYAWRRRNGRTLG